MEDLYEKMDAYSSASSVAQPLPSPTDEMSVFLQQILVRSSSSSAAAAVGVFGSDGISAVDSSAAYVSKNTGREIGHNASSSSLEPGGNDIDDYDCESEEGLEALVEEMSAKSANPRGSSKRSRAAEVHNLSEKRRRSRINEKMKALQNLIPNSNKTDKASMLDEAIEYLKQLQLQVQMLAMRNGLTLYPATLPGGSHPAHISPTRIDFGDKNRSLHQIPTSQQTASAPNLSSLPNQSASSNQQLLSNIINIVSSDATVGLEPPIQTRHGTFQHQSSAHDTCNENGLINPQRNGSNSETSHLGYGVDSIPIREGDWSENLLLTAIEQSLLLPTQVNSMRTERNASMEDFRVERTKL